MRRAVVSITMTNTAMLLLLARQLLAPRHEGSMNRGDYFWYRTNDTDIRSHATALAVQGID